MTTAQGLIPSEKPQAIDSEAWTGRRQWSGGRNKVLIVLVYALIGPPIGSVLFLGPFAVGLFYVSYFVAIIPAVLSGIAVASVSPNRRLSLLAALVAPTAIYSLLTMTGGEFVGAMASVDKEPGWVVPLIGIASSLICWLITLPLQRPR